MKYQNEKDLITNIIIYLENPNKDLLREIRERLDDLELHPEHIPYAINWTTENEIIQILNSIGYTIAVTDKHYHVMKLNLIVERRIFR